MSTMKNGAILQKCVNTFVPHCRNNFGVIFLLCVHGFRFVYISRSCLLRSEGLYLKVYFSQAFKFSELKLQI